MASSGGGKKLLDKKLIIIVLVAFALIVHSPPGVSLIIAFVLLIATVFAVYHNGVQVSDAIVFFVLGVFLTQTYLGDGATNAVNYVTDWVATLPMAKG